MVPDETQASARLERIDHWIGGRATPAADGRTYESADPYTGRPWALVADCGTEDVDRAVRAARSALGGAWGVKYVLVSHNTRMGAAKGVVLTAELVRRAGKF